MDDTIEPGDAVRIKEYVTAPMLYPNDFYTVPAVKNCVVESLQKNTGWPYPESTARCEWLDESGAQAITRSVELRHLELVRKGPGYFVQGVSRPYSQRELSEQRLKAWRAKVDAAPIPEHQGFRNAATFLAWRYLMDTPAFCQNVPGLRRQDGTINPNKIEKEFRRLRLRVDVWAFDCPIDEPPEYKHCWRPGTERLEVRWQDIADYFKDTTVKNKGAKP